MLDVLKYIFLGLLQGLTEVLPISSSAHLLIASSILGLSDDSMFFEVLLHVASLIAVCYFMRKRLLELIKGFFKFIFKKDRGYIFEFKYVMMIIVSTLIVVIFTVLTKDFIDKVTSKLFIVGILLMCNGLLLFYLSKSQGTRNSRDMNFKDAIVIGLFECLGVFPGISRSGSCLCGAFSRKLDKDTAADYAFMLFIPACLGALALELFKINELVIETSTIYLYLISFIVTIISTYYAFKLFLKVIKTKKLSIFSIYTLILGLLVFLLNILK